jgi:hypothetical protein
MVTLSAGDNLQRVDSLLAQLLDLCIAGIVFSPGGTPFVLSNSSLAGPNGRLPVRWVLKLVVFLYSLLGTETLDESHEQPLRRLLAGILVEHAQPVDGKRLNRFRSVLLKITSVGWLGGVRAELQKHLSGRSKQESSQADFENWEWKEEAETPASTPAATSDTHEKLYKAVDEKLAAALETARKAGALRSDFSALRQLLQGAGAPLYVPLVQQLVTQLFDEKLSEVADLQRQEGSALGSLLKTGFRWAALRIN